MKAHSFDIMIRGENYFIDVIEGKGNMDVFIEKDNEEWEDIPKGEMLMVVNYLVQEGFIKKPKFF
jgi:hypothetical protein